MAKTKVYNYVHECRRTSLNYKRPIIVNCFFQHEMFTIAKCVTSINAHVHANVLIKNAKMLERIYFATQLNRSTVDVA